MRLFKRKKEKTIDPSEARFDAMVELVKDLPKDEFNKLSRAMKQAWDAYQTVRGLETVDDQIVKAEAVLEEEE